MAELADLAAQKTPAGMDEIFFACSGSEANDKAIKMICCCWNLKGRPDQKAIISRDLAEVLAACIDNGAARGKTITVVNDDNLAVGSWRKDFGNLPADP